MKRRAEHPASRARRTRRGRDAAAGTGQGADLGLAPLEADAYAYLLGQGPCTGYRIAHALGRSISSTYKTIEGLQRAGAVRTSDEGGVRLVRATPLAEFGAARQRCLDAALGSMEHAAAERAREAEGAVADERVYHLHTPEQAMEKARALVASATDFVLVTATPRLAQALRADLGRAGARAVHVGVKVFEPLEIEGVRVFVDPRGTSAVDRGPGEWLVLTADGREFVQAIFTHDLRGLNVAVTTCHALMNWSLYTGLSSDVLLAATRQWIAAGATGAEVEARIREHAFFQTARSDSKRELLARFTAPGARAGAQPG